jgi:alkanesulfonate monooxygenase SsuD/methylene tetrahydromethanopterin reductase-like flavin-dependent oxidoreductase (luciferase family)
LLLAAVAAATERIRLATTSYPLPLRHPLQAAEQVAVLDQLSAGRVILGVGRGYAPHMLRAFNVQPRDKRTLFESCLACMMQAWAGEAVAPPGVAEGSGERVTIDPLPVQRPHPPIWVAAFGPKALAQAGGLGMPYLASPVETLEVLQANYQVHAAAEDAAGKPPSVDRPVMRALLITDDAGQTRRVREALQARARAGGRLAADASVDDWSIVGEAGYVAERVAEYRERLAMTHLITARLGLADLPADLVARSVARCPEVLAG